MQLKVEEDGFVKRLISDEATFHVSSKAKTHNVRISGTEQPHAQIEHQRDCPEVKVFCAVSREKVHGPFFFTEATVTGDSFLDMLENWLLLQLNTNYEDYVLQLDGAPHIFTRMYEFSIAFFHSAGSDVLQIESTTFSLGRPVRRISHHAISFFGGSLKTAFMYTCAHAHP
jgi:hypothetical protein